MSQVIKIGGALLQEPLKAVAALRDLLDGPTVIVHGGGIQITTMIKSMNLQSTFVEGLRVTDDQTLRAVCLALLGEVHVHLVHALQAAGIPAVGVFGGVRAQRKPGPWGLVGADLESDASIFEALLAQRKVPVVPTLAIGPESVLNVNGDETASALAVGLHADRLVFMTDVPGVRDASGKVIERAPNIDELLASEFVSGGMIPKLRGVKAALSGGVRLVMVGQTRFETAS